MENIRVRDLSVEPRPEDAGSPHLVPLSRVDHALRAALTDAALGGIHVVDRSLRTTR